MQLLLIKENQILRNEVLDKLISVFGKWPDTSKVEIRKELEEFQSQAERTCCASGVRGNLSDPIESGNGGLVDVKQLARILNVSENWIYQRTRKNTIPHKRVGKYRKFYVDEVLRFLQETQKGEM